MNLMLQKEAMEDSEALLKEAKDLYARANKAQQDWVAALLHRNEKEKKIAIYEMEYTVNYALQFLKCLIDNEVLRNR